MLFADIAIPVTVDKLFTYKVPEELQGAAKPGVRVMVPFGKRSVIGVIIALSKTDPSKGIPLKHIRDLVDIVPVLSPDMIELAKWMSEYYFASLGDVLRTVLFQGSTRAPKRTVSLLPGAADCANEISKSAVKAAIVRELEDKGTMSIARLQKLTGTKSIYAPLLALSELGAIAIEEEESNTGVKAKYEKAVVVNAGMKAKWREEIAALEPSAGKKRIAKQIEILNKLLLLEEDISLNALAKKTGISVAVFERLAGQGLIEIIKKEFIRSVEYDEYSSSMRGKEIILNGDQVHAVREITEKAQTGEFHAFLLHGITGSGKTQVYIEAIRTMLAAGKTAIVLVPEISLTSQIVRRFRRYFGDTVVALHSRMTPGERFDAWRLAHEGRCNIVIGPRSAVFAPLQNLGIIVVDEEHENAYKQFDKTPRYHGRDVAIVRAKLAGAVVVLGSATPSLESYANAANGKYALLELPERIDDAKLPVIEIVDMLAERKNTYAVHKEEQKIEREKAKAALLDQPKYVKFEFGSLSVRLKELIADRLRKREGIILLQNRRGFSPIIECPDCGNVEMCENCHISMTYHATVREIRCHYCGLAKRPPDACAQCGSIDLDYKGFGTQRVEDELQREFPDAKLIRMDMDTTGKRGSHDAILKRFAEGDADILLGTQMVAKGLDFSRVSLVGVISADTQMLLPDFRSSESTFQLLTQVAGRAGRSTIAGEVVIQTMQPKHPGLKHVLNHDFKKFFAEEMEQREELSYPPLSRILLAEFNGKDEKTVMAAAQLFAGLLQPYRKLFTILGPAPAAITKLRTMYRWHIVIKDLKSKDPSGSQLHRALKKVFEGYDNTKLKNIATVRVIIDVDPVGMM